MIKKYTKLQLINLLKSVQNGGNNFVNISSNINKMTEEENNLDNINYKYLPQKEKEDLEFQKQLKEIEEIQKDYQEKVKEFEKIKKNKMDFLNKNDINKLKENVDEILDKSEEVLKTTGKVLFGIGKVLVTPVNGVLGRKHIPLLAIGKGIVGIAKIISHKR